MEFELQEGVQSYWRVLEKSTGQEVARFQTQGFFQFHHVNAYETTSPDSTNTSHTITTIIVDLVAYPDASGMQALY